MTPIQELQAVMARLNGLIAQLFAEARGGRKMTDDGLVDLQTALVELRDCVETLAVLRALR